MQTPIPSSPLEKESKAPQALSITTTDLTSPPPTPKATSSPTRALIIIDLQNEFLSPAGNFPISDLCRARLLSNLKTLIPSFRKNGGDVIWVKAIYPPLSNEPASMAAHSKGDGVVGENEWLANATHVHPTPCCAAGTFGSEIYPEIFDLKEEGDEVVVKEWYSAFHGEKAIEFAGLLREKGVQELWFCGVASGTCVLASVVDAVKIGGGGEWDVKVVPECMGWRRENTHVEALRRFEKLGVEIVGMEDGL